MLRAWARSHELGADPLAPRPERLSTLETERLQAREGVLLDAARPYLAALVEAAGRQQFGVSVSDRDAVILEITGDPLSLHGPDPLPSPGTLMSEGVSGANGVGTPLAEGGYVELVGPEHFMRGFHQHVCQGIPLRGPDGEVAGVLATGVRRADASERIREVLVCAAHGVECELLRGKLDQDVRRAIAAESTAGEALDRAVDDLYQDLLQAGAATRLGLQAAARMMGQSQFALARGLVEVADAAARRFHRQATLWRDLASTEKAAPRAISLPALVTEMLDLLSTEARARGVELVPGTLEPAVVHAEPNSLARALLRVILRALDAAGEGGVVHVQVGAPFLGRAAEVRALPEPATAGLHGPPGPLVLTVASDGSGPDDGSGDALERW